MPIKLSFAASCVNQLGWRYCLKGFSVNELCSVRLMRACYFQHKWKFCLLNSILLDEQDHFMISVLYSEKSLSWASQFKLAQNSNQIRLFGYLVSTILSYRSNYTSATPPPTHHLLAHTDNPSIRPPLQNQNHCLRFCHILPSNIFPATQYLGMFSFSLLKRFPRDVFPAD